MAWVLIGLAEIALPMDPALKLPALVAVVLILAAGMMAMAVRIYRYAIGLVSGHL